MLSHYIQFFGGCLYTCIYGLFGNAVGSTDYKGLTGSIIRWLTIGNMWNEVAIVPIWSTILEFAFKDRGKL
jgi:hypothetical protein